MKPPSSSSKATNPAMASGNNWSKFINVLGLLGFIFAIVSVVPIAEVASSSRALLSHLNDFLTKKPEIVVIDEAAKYEHGCPEHLFDSVKIVSRAPDIMIIEGFLTKFEAEYLINLAEPIFEDSKTVEYDSGGGNEVNKRHRSSVSAYLPLSYQTEHKILRCIEERAAAFQGHIPVTNMETLQVVKYEKGQYFRQHWDWFDPEKDKNMGQTGNRATTFFVYLLVQCEGGATVFPDVSRPAAREWCDLLRCEDEKGNPIEHLEVLAKEGTAVFWHNFKTSGELDELTLHAGADVLNGTKIGLNIWTREGNYRYE